MRGFDGAARFDPAQASQQLGGVDFGDGSAANPGEEVLLHADAGSVGVAFGRLGVVHRAEPFTRHGFEAGFRGKAGVGQALGLPLAPAAAFAALRTSLGSVPSR